MKRGTINITLRGLLLVFLTWLLLSPPPASAAGGAPDNGKGNGGGNEERASEAQRAPGGELPIEVTADSISFDGASNTYKAEGNVIISQGGITLKAERLTADLKAQLATATEGLTLTDEGGNEITAARVTLNLEDKTAYIEDGRLYFRLKPEGRIIITGKEIRKTGPERYTSLVTTYTTCDCNEDEKPDWSFHTKSSELIVGERFTGRGALFKVRGVPLIYSPYVTFPLKTERKSGLLTPGFSISKLRGFTISNSLFWAISDSRDATLYLDIETRRGVGTGGEFRYIRSKRSHGELNLYYFNEKDIERVRSFRLGDDNLGRPKTAGTKRWLLSFTGSEVLTLGVKLSADINVISDDEYYMDFGEGTLRSLEGVESTISLTKNWPGATLTGEVRNFDNLLVANDGIVVQRYPEVRFSTIPKRLASSQLLTSIDSTFVNLYRRTGEKALRLDLRPTASLPMTIGGIVEFTPSVTAIGTLYNISSNGGGTGGYKDRFTYEAKGDLRTTLVRYSASKSSPLRTTLRPRVRYTYLPGTRDQGVAQFDSFDITTGKNIVEYSLNSTITSKGGNYDRKVYLNIEQSFDVNESTRRIDTPGDRREPFSNLSGEVIFSPYSWLRVRGEGEYQPYIRRVIGFDASLYIESPKGNDDRLSISYLFSDDVTEYIELRGRKMILGKVEAEFAERFSFDKGTSIESNYTLTYHSGCWEAGLSYRSRLEENTLFFTVGLQGLG